MVYFDVKTRFWLSTEALPVKKRSQTVSKSPFLLEIYTFCCIINMLHINFCEKYYVTY
ncbi:hypothetical protein THIOM_004409 [Candidatus Thiomargarita nelsonii]|uniref:Uncharacterized protein n=1 Tax=Candidatus Thiomargarita nelsonii TaxID=1003181 RepID=A0A176RW18_9GAMM|nr:hypothetical protein THIOM_004409 [Candidatus Thiomargarita nelsonii]